MELHDVIAELHKLKLNMTNALNALQLHGIISDNCIAASDVPRDEWPACIAWLKLQSSK